jgi:hypothetical protein
MGRPGWAVAEEDTGNLNHKELKIKAKSKKRGRLARRKKGKGATWLFHQTG